MSISTADQIRCAYQEKRLVAIHTDLQVKTYSKHPIIHRAYEQTEILSFIMREANIPNIWIAMHREKLSMAESFKSVSEYKDYIEFKNEATNNRYESDHLSRLVGAHNDEIVIVKQRANALSFANPTNLEYLLDHMKKDTVLIGGVSAHCCVYRTLKEGAMAGKFNLIAVGDTIDSIECVESYTNKINQDSQAALPQGHRIKRPVKFTNITEIENALI
jgi:isochorismate hydrolase